jgi:hypothetical protein
VRAEEVGVGQEVRERLGRRCLVAAAEHGHGHAAPEKAEVLEDERHADGRDEGRELGGLAQGLVDDAVDAEVDPGGEHGAHHGHEHELGGEGESRGFMQA